MSKTARIGVRVMQEYKDEIQNIISLYKEKTGIDVKETAIVELALKEGLPIVRRAIERQAEYKINK